MDFSIVTDNIFLSKILPYNARITAEREKEIADANARLKEQNDKLPEKERK